MKPIRSDQSLTLSEAIAVSNVVETYVSHEISLIGHRMTWLVISQSFLVGGFAATLCASHESADITGLIRYILLFGIPILGATISWCAYKSVRAANLVLDELCQCRAMIVRDINAAAEFNIPFLGIQREGKLANTVKDGHLPSRLIPPMFLCAWILLIVVFGVASIASYSCTTAASSDGHRPQPATMPVITAK